MFNKELKKEVKDIKDNVNNILDFLEKENIVYGRYSLSKTIKFDKAMSSSEKISELEAKIDALMELLAVKEIQPETERKLKKGNKEVVIGKKSILTIRDK